MQVSRTHIPAHTVGRSGAALLPPHTHTHTPSPCPALSVPNLWFSQPQFLRRNRTSQVNKVESWRTASGGPMWHSFTPDPSSACGRVGGEPRRPRSWSSRSKGPGRDFSDREIHSPQRPRAASQGTARFWPPRRCDPASQLRWSSKFEKALSAATRLRKLPESVSRTFADAHKPFVRSVSVRLHTWKPHFDRRRSN
jgi:hypothetical protein